MAASLEPSPALGMLSRLSQEIRDIIYDLTFYTLDEGVNIFSPCKPRSSLLLVSKELNIEVTAAIEHKKEWPCEHAHFRFTSASAEDRRERGNSISSPLSLQHNLGNTVQLQFIGHYDAGARPLKLTYKFLPRKSMPEVSIDLGEIAHDKTEARVKTLSKRALLTAKLDYTTLEREGKGKKWLLEELVVVAMGQSD